MDISEKFLREYQEKHGTELLLTRYSNFGSHHLKALIERTFCRNPILTQVNYLVSNTKSYNMNVVE